MAKEFNLLRLQLLDRNEEIETLKRSKLQEIDRAKTEAYDRAEKRFLENSKIKETRFQEEKAELQKQLDNAVEQESKKYNRLYMSHALTKWRLMTQIMKLKMGGGEFSNQTLDDIIALIQ